MSVKVRLKIAQKAIKMQNMMTINACLETTDNIYYEDVIFVDFCRGIENNTGGKTYDTNNSLSFKFSSLALRELGYGINELIATKKTTYKKVGCFLFLAIDMLEVVIYNVKHRRLNKVFFRKMF